MQLPEKRIHSGNAGRMLLGSLGLLIAELYTKINISRVNKMSRKGGAGISHNGLKTGGLRLVAFAEVRRKAASMDADAPGRGRMGQRCDQGLGVGWGVAVTEAGLVGCAGGDSRSRVKSWDSSLRTARRKAL